MQQDLPIDQAFDLALTDVDHAEASLMYALIDSAHVIDELGVSAFLSKVLPIINNPAEQHIARQLLAVLKQHERVFLSMDKAEEVLTHG